MKSVGIMTWYFGANYGAIAQSVALFKTIQSLGYDSKMIAYKPKNYAKTIIATNIPKKGRRLLKINETIRGLLKYRILTENKYLEETAIVNTADEINNLGLDEIVFGSDAIFNTEHLLCSPLYYGVGIKTRKMTYSPSCEYLDPNTRLPEDYIQSLEEMAALSVRDQNTYELIKNNTGLKPKITLDPTFLYDFKDITDLKPSGKYLMIYSFSSWDEYKEPIREYAQSNGLKIVSVGMHRRWADENLPAATFETWIQSFRGADAVLTDSFHGTVFSLKNGKQIILCGRKDKMAKIRSLLNQMGCNIGLYKGENVSEYLKQNHINYDEVNRIMAAHVKDSKEYLTQALSD